MLKWNLSSDDDSKSAHSLYNLTFLSFILKVYLVLNIELAITFSGNEYVSSIEKFNGCGLNHAFPIYLRHFFIVGMWVWNLPGPRCCAICISFLIDLQFDVLGRTWYAYIMDGHHIKHATDFVLGFFVVLTALKGFTLWKNNDRRSLNSLMTRVILDELIVFCM